MIVTRGIGRSIAGASGALVASGLCIVAQGGLGQPNTFTNQQAITTPRELRYIFDDRDLLDIIPIIVEIINDRR